MNINQPSGSGTRFTQVQRWRPAFLYDEGLEEALSSACSLSFSPPNKVTYLIVYDLSDCLIVFPRSDFVVTSQISAIVSVDWNNNPQITDTHSTCTFQLSFTRFIFTLTFHFVLHESKVKVKSCGSAPAQVLVRQVLLLAISLFVCANTSKECLLSFPRAKLTKEKMHQGNYS